MTLTDSDWINDKVNLSFLTIITIFTIVFTVIFIIAFSANNASVFNDASASAFVFPFAIATIISSVFTAAFIIFFAAVNGEKRYE